MASSAVDGVPTCSSDRDTGRTCRPFLTQSSQNRGTGMRFVLDNVPSFIDPLPGSSLEGLWSPRVLTLFRISRKRVYEKYVMSSSRIPRCDGPQFRDTLGLVQLLGDKETVYSYYYHKWIIPAILLTQLTAFHMCRISLLIVHNR